MNEYNLAESVEIGRIYQEKLMAPFPYADCRHVRAQAGEQTEGLIPDLDLYFSDVAGYCSRGKRFLRLSKDELLAARKILARSFFEKHSEYLSLSAFINETDTPTLFADLKLHDELRVRLLAIISTLLTEAEAVEPAYAAASHYSPQRKSA